MSGQLRKVRCTMSGVNVLYLRQCGKWAGGDWRVCGELSRIGLAWKSVPKTLHRRFSNRSVRQGMHACYLTAARECVLMDRVSVRAPFTTSVFVDRRERAWRQLAVNNTRKLSGSGIEQLRTRHRQLEESMEGKKRNLGWMWHAYHLAVACAPAVGLFVLIKCFTHEGLTNVSVMV